MLGLPRDETESALASWCTDRFQWDKSKAFEDMLAFQPKFAS